jgi:4-diphosphocytidyl-2-C-methyl-D-erythritol kinase
MDEPEFISVKACAKLNLGLEIVEKRRDGYHNLKSVMQAIDIYDVIRITKSEKNEITGAVVCEPEKNLAYLAKKEIENATGKSLECIIDVQKTIPISAGLGGGSSDAGAVLTGLNRLYSLGIPVPELSKIGAEIGADVPFFVENISPALAEGKGERISPYPEKTSCFYIIARPHKRISTSESFREYDETGKTLLEIAIEKAPSIERMLSFFSVFTDNFGMSGTGPSLYAGFESYKEAENSLSALPKGVAGFNGDIFICRALNYTNRIIASNVSNF